MLVLVTAGCSRTGPTAGNKDKAGKTSITLRFGHALTENDLYNQAMLTWAAEVAKATDGGLKIEIYPNSLLGTEEDVLEQMRQGTNIGWQTDFARAGNYVRELSVLNAPYFMENISDVKKLMQSPALTGWLDTLAEQYGLKAVSFAYIQGYRNIFSNKAAKNPQEMRKLSIRTANAPVWVNSVKSLGCTAVSLPYGDIYTGIQTKVVDGCELPYPAALNSKINEVTKYIIETRHIYQLNLMLVSNTWFKSLPEKYQTVLKDTCDACGFEVSQKLAGESEKAKETMIQAGMTLIPYNELDSKAFKTASQEAYRSLNLDTARDEIYKDIGKTVTK
jgi:TRAP-type C4-dicarboxylate transport system substrate-binding protein